MIKQGDGAQANYRRSETLPDGSPVVYYTYILPLHDDIFKTVSKDVRQNIRKAQKQGISSTRKFDPGIFWDLMVRTFEKQGKQTPVSERHLAGMLAMIQEKGIGEMRVASTSSGEMAAAEVTVWDAKMAHSWSAAAARNTSPPGRPRFSVMIPLPRSKSGGSAQ